MKIAIYSRISLELLFHKNFPQNTAVISLYDPDRYNNDKSYKIVDYSGKADSVLYIPLDDFQTELLEATKIAGFVYSAKSKKVRFIYQCESVLNRSAGCAAAILKYFSKSEGSIFNDNNSPLTKLGTTQY